MFRFFLRIFFFCRQLLKGVQDFILISSRNFIMVTFFGSIGSIVVFVGIRRLYLKMYYVFSVITFFSIWFQRDYDGFTAEGLGLRQFLVSQQEFGFGVVVTVFGVLAVVFVFFIQLGQGSCVLLGLIFFFLLCGKIYVCCCRQLAVFRCGIVS